nr:phosphoglycerate kinase [bacterium]
MGKFNKQTVRDLKLKGKRVLLRVDYNVPLDKSGKVASDYRVEMSLPTIKYLIEQKCQIVICSHLGRPKNEHDMSCSLEPVALVLANLLKKPVKFTDNCIGDNVKKAASELKQGEILMLENLRFHEGEESNDQKFAETLVADTGAEVFVQDAFGVVHRAHASTSAVTKLLPSVAGLLVESEFTTLSEVIDKPKRPLLTIVGGAKISDKIEIIERFISIADGVVIGGAMANTFVKSEGIDIGDSLYDKEDLPLARKIIKLARAEAKKRRFVFYLPQDGVVAKKIDTFAKTRIVDWDAHVIASIEAYPSRPDRKSAEV